MRGFIVLFNAIVLLFAANSQQTLTYYQNGVGKGFTSWYDSWAPGGGCGYNENIYAGYQPSVVLTAAINLSNKQGQYYDGEVCGMCIQVKNVTAIGSFNNLKPFPDPPFYAFINNLCTTCTDNQLDFYRTPQVQNNWYLDWIAVDCPVGATKIRYQIEKGSHNYFFKFLPLYNLRILTSASVYQNQGWNACERQNGYFACQASGGAFGSNPQIRLTSVDQATVTDSIQITLPSGGTPSIQVVNGMQNVNFAPLFNGGSTPTASNQPVASAPTSNSNTPSTAPLTSSPPTTSPTNNNSPANSAPIGNNAPGVAPTDENSPSGLNTPVNDGLTPRSQSTPTRSNVPSTNISSSAASNAPVIITLLSLIAAFVARRN